MRWRLLAVAGLLVLAGCGAVPADDPTPDEAVTPAPVPSSTGELGAAASQGPAVENGTAVGPAVEARHAASLSVPYRRVLRLRVDTPNETLLAYNENLTRVSGGNAVLERHYAGPATSRFVPDARNATSARTIQYDNGTRVTRRSFVDGGPRDAEAPPLTEPGVRPGGTDVALLLDSAALLEEMPGRGYRLGTSAVPDAAVPGFLAAVRNGTVNASVRADGRIRRLTVRYEARLDDRPVVVTQTLTWTRPVDRELR